MRQATTCRMPPTVRPTRPARRHRAKEDASKVGHKLSDAIEDVIPGDSDGDGH